MRRELAEAEIEAIVGDVHWQHSPNMCNCHEGAPYDPDAYMTSYCVSSWNRGVAARKKRVASLLALLSSDDEDLSGTLDVDYVLDIDGKPVRVGDRVAYAAADSELRLGEVLEIREAHQRYESWDIAEHYPYDVPTKLRVRVDKHNSYGEFKRPVLIETRYKRFVRL